jgi:selenide, water dikinase
LKRLLLLGGGHAHVQVVHAFATAPPPATEVTLMDRGTLAPYSGMLPGLIAGHYSVRESHIDLAALCRWARIRFVHEEAVALELEQRRVLGAQGCRHDYDVLSIDTGSTPPLDAVAGASRHAIAVKPIDAFLAAIDLRLPALARDPTQTLAVVGGGAGAFEVVLALEHRIRTVIGAAHAPRLQLVADTAHILPGFCARVRRIGAERLHAQGIAVHAGSAVCCVDDSGLVLASGERLDARHVVFATGASPPPMYHRSGLQTDTQGFIAVDAALQSLSHANVFASGDVAAVVEHPRPKAGVFAVRQGPPLTRNLRRVLAGEPPLAFVPQRHAAALLSTGRKHAIASRGGFTVAGDWVWRWKDRIDRSFVERFGAPMS